MSEEMIEEIDWNENIIAVHPKSKLKGQNYIRKVSLVIPKTFDNKYIISKRAEDKQPWPGTWVCAIGGKVEINESYEQAALRETMEEAGAKLDLVYVTSFKHDSEEYKGIFKIFTTKEPIDIKQLTPNPDEIQYFKSFTLEQIETNIKLNPDDFAPTFITALKSFVVDIKKI
jgi:isopentenyldiphosphate isomerase